MKNTISYKNYTGTVEFDEKKGVFFGKVLGMRHAITYSGTSADELIKDFHTATDNYLKSCERKKEAPERPFKGSFNVRVSPDMHREAAEFARDHNVTLNTFVNQALREYFRNHKDD